MNLEAADHEGDQGSVTEGDFPPGPSAEAFPPGPSVTDEPTDDLDVDDAEAAEVTGAGESSDLQPCL